MKRRRPYRRHDFTHALTRPNWWLPVCLCTVAVAVVIFMLWARSAASQAERGQRDHRARAQLAALADYASRLSPQLSGFAT